MKEVKQTIVSLQQNIVELPNKVKLEKNNTSVTNVAYNNNVYFYVNTCN